MKATYVYNRRINYPYVGVYHHSGGNSGQVTYVKFISPGKGVMVHSTANHCDPLNTKWNEHCYKPMVGELVLSNDDD